MTPPRFLTDDYKWLQGLIRRELIAYTYTINASITTGVRYTNKPDLQTTLQLIDRVKSL